MDDVMAVVLDLANIVGGFLLAIGLLALLPGVGKGLRRGAGLVEPFGWVVGIVALVAGGYFLIKHIVDGPHVFHFEVVGVAVGVCLLWERLRGGTGLVSSGVAGSSSVADPSTEGGGALVRTRREPATSVETGTTLLLAVFGLIAIVVGIEGLFTGN